MSTEQGLRALVAYNLYKDGKGSVYKNFTVNGTTVNVQSITLNTNNVEMAAGDTNQLTAVIAPDNASNKNVNWSSNDPSIATVDENGKVTALKEGTVTITATTEDKQEVKAECTVNVTSSKQIIITNLTEAAAFSLGNDAKVIIQATNNSDEDQDVSLIVALYDNSGEFVNYVCAKQSIKKGDSSVLTNMMKLPEEGQYILKAFVWDSMEAVNSLSNTIEIPVN